MTKFRRELGMRIVEAREKTGLTQLELSEQTGVLLDDVVLDNPTRADIETLVRVLGGSAD